MSKFIVGLLAILIYIVVIEGQANSDKCCQVKTVGGKKYVLVDPEGTTPESCKDSCVYAYANAGNEERFCFRPGNMISECHSESNNSNSIGVLIAGGWYGGEVSSAEVYNPITRTTCSVGDLPAVRSSFSLCHGMACGGYPDTNYRSCVKFEADGTFTPMFVTLREERYWHLCWSLPSGEVLLLGGWGSPATTERVSADGSSSSADFTLPYDTSEACGIDLGDSYVVTGGVHEGVANLQKVAQYTLSGEVTYLADLQQGRRQFACTSFTDDNGVTTLLVTGGSDGSGVDGFLSSTEIYVESAWSYIASLPSPARIGLSAATLDNSVFVFGGYDPTQLDEILLYNPNTDSWTMAGKMSIPRAFHAVTVLPNIKNICRS